MKPFPAAARGFVDAAALRKLLADRLPAAAPVLEAFGLDGLESVTFRHGFDGAAMRTQVSLAMPGERRGLLQASRHKPFTLADLPKLPPDLTGFTAWQLDPGSVFDLALEVAGRLGSGERTKAAVAAADERLGLKVREDLLDSLGPLWVTYASHTEGIMFLGQTLLVQVKDEAKLRAALGKLAELAKQQSRGRVQVRRQGYHGVDVHTVHVAQEGFVLVPTFAVHQGWLVAGLFPQPVHGYLLRATGVLPAWKPDRDVAATLKRLPAEYRYLAVTDPRPGLAHFLAWSPFFAAALQNVQINVALDVAALPNAYEVTQHLFPNVTVAVDDGKTLRPVYVHVHGNLLPADSALGSVMWAHSWLDYFHALPPDAVVVGFDWPSERVEALRLVDVNEKGRRATVAGYHLAQFLQALPDGGRVCVLGHSYGGWITAAALHLLAGGCVDGDKKGATVCLAGPVPCLRLRAILLGAAFDHQWLDPGERFGRGLESCEAILNLYDHRDRVMLWYPYLLVGDHHRAMGRVGFTPKDLARLGPLAQRVAQRDIADQIGREHTLKRSVANPDIARSIAFYTFAEEAGAAAR